MVIDVTRPGHAHLRARASLAINVLVGTSANHKVLQPLILLVCVRVFTLKKSLDMAGLVKAKKYDWKDSNLALFGSDTEKQVKKESAESEPAWRGAGQKVGVQIWRIVKFKVSFFACMHKYYKLAC